MDNFGPCNSFNCLGHFKNVFNDGDDDEFTPPDATRRNVLHFNSQICMLQVTSLPSSLQENCGFKAQELSEQAPHEGSDDVAEKPPNHWMINDLVLFVDSEDTPRIPKQLFDEVTQIRVAGVPGPVYLGHVEAFRQLVKIVLFILLVFIVVLSFGTVYKVKLRRFAR